MYYNEKVINGVLHCKTSPDGEWRPLSPEALTSRLIQAEKLIKNELERVKQ